MSSKSFVLPSEDLTWSEKQDLRVNCLAGGIQRAISQGIFEWEKAEFPTVDPNRPKQPLYSDILNFVKAKGWPKGLDVREFQPVRDAGAALDQWNTAALAAAGTEYSVFQAIAAPAAALRNKTIVVWYGVTILTVPLSVSRLIFRKTNATGTVMYEFDLEQLAAAQRLEGYFSEPVVWDNNMPYAINVMAKGMPAVSTGILAEVIIKNFLFEPAGTVNV